MERTIHFCSGMPRAGSTLLMNILAQNPRIGVTPTSGLYEIVRHVHVMWGKVSEFRAIEEKRTHDTKKRVLAGMLASYHEDHDRPVVLNKSRGWLTDLELLENVMGRPPKVLVPVRPLTEILASFEALFRRAKQIQPVPHEDTQTAAFQTVEGRVNVLLANGDVIGGALNRVRDAVSRGWREHLHFVEFDRLTRHPKTVMGEIYEFLDEDPFEHDFEHVEQITEENDRVHGWGDLHTIRGKVKPVQSKFQTLVAPHLRPPTVQAIKGDDTYWPRSGGGR